MRLLFPIIVLGFIFSEIYLLIVLGERYGIWLLLYLVLVGYLGLQLIRSEKQLMSAKMMQSVQAGGNPLKTMMGSARNFMAGILLMIPGILTDIIAAILLLIPFKQPEVDQYNESYQTDGSGYEGRFRQSGHHSANDDVIEGEYEEVKDGEENVTQIDNGENNKN
ncbi:MAG TPA: FxsA family protein [Methylophilaceae bacterium]|nr:FxsA family protein [Methylophilaceae bacterium]